MDMREASAMTEASGLTDAQGGIEQASAASPEAGRGRSTRLRQMTLAWSIICKMTIKAPLQSLVVAFLLGVWVARRR
jgi:hypothetical protein